MLRILLTEAERAMLDKTADAKALDVSSWARMVLLETARNVPAK